MIIGNVEYVENI